MIKEIFERSKNQVFPSMRDTKKNPKCYDLTDQERIEAAQRVDLLLQNLVQLTVKRVKE